VVPVDGSSVDRCRVTMDYWLDVAAVNQAAGPAAAAGFSPASSALAGAQPPQAVLDAALQSQFVQDSLRDSHQVQVRVRGAAQQFSLRGAGLGYQPTAPPSWHMPSPDRVCP
jgi:hypothetical protein